MLGVSMKNLKFVEILPIKFRIETKSQFLLTFSMRLSKINWAKKEP